MSGQVANGQAVLAAPNGKSQLALATAAPAFNVAAKPQQNQKECVKNELRKHFARVQASGNVPESISSNTLRDAIVPLVKKQMSLSYTIGPKLMYDWAQEVNEQYFQKSFNLHYSSNSYRARGSRGLGAVHGNASHALARASLEAAQAAELKKDYERLQKDHQLLTNSFAVLARTSKDNQALISLLANQANERNMLLDTIRNLTSECSHLTSLLDVESTGSSSRKRKLNNSQAASVSRANDTVAAAQQLLHRTMMQMNATPTTPSGSTTTMSMTDDNLTFTVSPTTVVADPTAAVTITVRNVAAPHVLSIENASTGNVVRSFPLPAGSNGPQRLPLNALNAGRYQLRLQNSVTTAFARATATFSITAPDTWEDESKMKMQNDMLDLGALDLF